MLRDSGLARPQERHMLLQPHLLVFQPKVTANGSGAHTKSVSTQTTFRAPLEEKEKNVALYI